MFAWGDFHGGGFTPFWLEGGVYEVFFMVSYEISYFFRSLSFL